MKTTGRVLSLLVVACSEPVPVESATDRAAPTAEAPDGGDSEPPAADCLASSPDAGTVLYQGRRVPSVMLTRRGCSLMIDYAIK